MKDSYRFDIHANSVALPAGDSRRLTPDGPPSSATGRWFLQPLHSPCRCRWDQILTYDISGARRIDNNPNGSSPRTNHICGVTLGLGGWGRSYNLHVAAPIRLHALLSSLTGSD